MATGTFTQSLVLTYVTVTCGKCGVAFAFEADYYHQRRKDHNTWYCPNGHPRVYGAENAAEREAREQRERAERLAVQLTRRGDDLARERRSHSATKGQLTKTRKRADHAMCPVDGCRRSFANGARHVANQHPGYVA